MRLRSSILLLATALACQPKASPTAGPSDAPPAASAPAAKPKIDAQRLFSVVEHLASDELGGRYTLSPDIATSAKYLAAAFADAGVDPVGDGYLHDFELVTGARAIEPPRLEIVRGKKTQAITSDDFAPYPTSATASVSGELVFVGYAARSRDEGKAYDDLAGVDLTGKIAVVLMHQPRSPDVREFFGAMRRRAREFETKVEPLRTAGETDEIAKLRKQAIADIVKMAEPWVPNKNIDAKAIAELEAVGATEPLDIGALGGVLSKAGDVDAPQLEGFGRTSEKVQRLADAGAIGVIVVEGPRSHVDAESKADDELPSLEGGGHAQREHYPLPVVRMKWKAADKHLRVGGKTVSALQKKIDTKLEPASAALGSTATLAVNLEPTKVMVPNVLATIPGRERAEEIVMLGAHYDHIGRDAEGQGNCHGRTLDDGTADGICNGADDNASGTAVVVELARAMAQAGYQPERTLVFTLFSGEEMGLLGSKAMAASMPTTGPFAKGKVVAMINIDMVGRLGEKGLAIGGVASSPQWMDILDGVGTFGMPILYDRAITTRSDHAAFYEKNIPVLFLFTHTHPDYHGPGDEAALINREGLASVAELVQGVAVELGNGHDIPFAAPANADEGLTRGLPGSNPATIEKQVPAPSEASTRPATSSP
jgi:hypothetical protein